MLCRFYYDKIVGKKRGDSVQFYDLFKSIFDNIPAGFPAVREFLTELMPYLLMGCALFTAFFGLKCASAWCCVTFFMLGGTVSAKLLLPAFNMYDFWFWVMFSVCIVIAILSAYFSQYLFRAQLVVSMFFLVYASLPAFVWYLGEWGAKIVSLVVACALAFLTVKYKYMLIIATTAFSGSFIFCEVMAERYAMPYEKPVGILMGVLAFMFQCFICRKQLKETYEDVKWKVEKTEQEGKKAYRYLDDKVHFHAFLNDESDVNAPDDASGEMKEEDFDEGQEENSESTSE